jgi:SSS family solute:Na+ symporter
MKLSPLDWTIIAFFFAINLVVGLVVARRAGRSTSDFFLSGRDQSWWLLGTSMVATTFAADTPLLVAGIVREKGVAGNWLWWSFLLTGMLTVAVFAKLWRRSGITTDNEFYELRYSGKPAAALRGFRAAYLGLVFNVVVMANVTLAAIKIGQVMFGFSPMQTVLVASIVTVIFSSAGGLTSVLVTDFILFIIAMIGSIGAAVFVLGLPEIGGLAGLVSNPTIQAKMSIFPSLDFSTTEGLNLAMTILIIPLSVQWWAAWYPGAEPGGGGYQAQRMLAAKDESHATGATMLFNVAHYALRPWPWIIVALASLVIYPDIESLKQSFSGLPDDMIKDDLAYPAMLQRLPAGLIGIVAVSLIAAYMSTISTQLNWGASYIVNDVYQRFIDPTASQRALVNVGRATTVLLMIGAALLATQLSSATQGFNLLLQIGAGTGLIYILRWFWWRINAAAEIVAMIMSFVMAATFFAIGKYSSESLPAEWLQFVIIVGVTTFSWMLAVFLGPEESTATLRNFYRKIRPGGPGWKRFLLQAHQEGELLEFTHQSNLPTELLFAITGCGAIYCALFATGYLLYGQYIATGVCIVISVACSIVLMRTWNRIASSKD